jgi:opacity protein-like surface antigen
MTKTTTVTRLALSFGAALTSLAGVGALAQTDTPAAKPITIKLGAFLPSGSYLKNATSNSWFSAGAEYDYAPRTAQAAASSLVPLGYIDYAGSNRHGVNARYIGVGPGVRYNLTPAGSSTITPYVGAGIGAYFLHASGFGGSSTRTNFGYRLNAGVEFNRSYIFEINYTDPESLDHTRFSGFNIQVGAKL